MSKYPILQASYPAVECPNCGHGLRVVSAVEAERLRGALEAAGRALNNAGWIEASQAALDALNSEGEAA